jgi:hypothetical protein
MIGFDPDFVRQTRQETFEYDPGPCIGVLYQVSSINLHLTLVVTHYMTSKGNF